MERQASLPECKEARRGGSDTFKSACKLTFRSAAERSISPEQVRGNDDASKGNVDVDMELRVSAWYLALEKSLTCREAVLATHDQMPASHARGSILLILSVKGYRTPPLDDMFDRFSSIFHARFEGLPNLLLLGLDGSQTLVSAFGFDGKGLLLARLASVLGLCFHMLVTNDASVAADSLKRHETML